MTAANGDEDPSTSARDEAVTVRVAGPDDAGTVGALTEYAYRVDGYLDLDGGDRYARELADGVSRITDAVVLVAELDGELVGTVTLATFGTPFAEVARPDELEVRMLAVAPQVRRRGVAAKLMEATLNRARLHRRTRIVLCTEASRHRVHRFYERLGYTRLPDRDWVVDGFALLGYGLDVD